MKRSILLIFLFFSCLFLFSQPGGKGVYSFLNIPYSARLAALGGNFSAIGDNDISIALVNPSLITAEMNKELSLSYIDYFTDINYGFAAYAHTFKKLGTFTGGIQYVNYGSFTQADFTGETYGTFHAADYCLQIGWGRSLDSLFTIGANLKTILSTLDSYNSFGLAVDIATTYKSKKKNFSASLIARNAGRQIVSYTNGNNEPLPFELQLGLSIKPQHIPVRLSVLITHLERYNLRYDSPLQQQADPLTGEVIKTSKIGEIADNLMRHFVIGAEISPAKFLSIRLGYNYQKRKEMVIDTHKGLVGFSFGFGLKISKFNINYARVIQHLSGSPNYITISTNISGFKKKSK